MARICNDERASFGVMSGHDRKTLSLSVPPRGMRKLGAARRFLVSPLTCRFASVPPRGMRKLGAARRFLVRPQSPQTRKKCEVGR